MVTKRSVAAAPSPAAAGTSNPSQGQGQGPQPPPSQHPQQGYSHHPQHQGHQGHYPADMSNNMGQQHPHHQGYYSAPGAGPYNNMNYPTHPQQQQVQTPVGDGHGGVPPHGQHPGQYPHPQYQYPNQYQNQHGVSYPGYPHHNNQQMQQQEQQQEHPNQQQPRKNLSFHQQHQKHQQQQRQYFSSLNPGNGYIIGQSQGKGHQGSPAASPAQASASASATESTGSKSGSKSGSKKSKSGSSSGSGNNGSSSSKEKSNPSSSGSSNSHTHGHGHGHAHTYTGDFIGKHQMESEVIANEKASAQSKSNSSSRSSSSAARSRPTSKSSSSPTPTSTDKHSKANHHANITNRTLIIDIQPNDVIHGRPIPNLSTSKHPGNAYYRQKLKKYYKRWVTAPIEKRPNFALLIYHDIVKQSPPGRFLQSSEVLDGYMEMTREEALNYILNVLDECERKEMERKGKKRRERTGMTANANASRPSSSSKASAGDSAMEGNRKRKRLSVSGEASASAGTPKTIQISPIVENGNGNSNGNGTIIGNGEVNGSIGAITDTTRRKQINNHQQPLSPIGNAENNDQMNKNSVSDDIVNAMDNKPSETQVYVDPIFGHDASAPANSLVGQSSSHPQLQSQSHVPQHLAEHPDHIGNPHMFCDKCIGTGLLPVPSHLLLFLNPDASPSASAETIAHANDNANACADIIIEEKGGDGTEINSYKILKDQEKKKRIETIWKEAGVSISSGTKDANANANTNTNTNTRISSSSASKSTSSMTDQLDTVWSRKLKAIEEKWGIDSRETSAMTYPERMKQIEEKAHQCGLKMAQALSAAVSTTGLGSDSGSESRKASMSPPNPNTFSNVNLDGLKDAHIVEAIEKAEKKWGLDDPRGMNLAERVVLVEKTALKFLTRVEAWL